MLRIKRIVVLLWVLIAGIKAYSQQPVQVTPQLLPPYSLQVSDYYGGVQPKLQLMLINRDINQPSITVRLRMTVQSQNCTMQTKATAVTQSFTLPSGIPYFLQPNELETYFDPNNLDFGGGYSQQEYITTGRFPEGLYTFTFEAYEVVSTNTVSNKGFAMAWLTLADPPLLNTPAKAEGVNPSLPQNIVFNWTPRHNTSPTAAYYTDYIFTLVEYNDLYVGPDASFNSSPPLFIDSVTTTTYLYGADRPQLVPGKRYAWRVQAKAKGSSSFGGGLAMFRNNGMSEVYWFTYQNNCPVPIGITATPVGQRVTIEWQGNPQHIDYKVEYREKNNATAQWFTVTNSIPRVVLSDLKPGTQYEYRVGGSCMEAIYTYSSLMAFSTNGAAANAVPACGDSTLPVPGGGTTLTSLPQNSIIHAGSFDVVVGYATGTGSFSGTGYVVVPWLMNAKVEVRFTGITLSQDYKLLSGVIETTYDPNESGIDDIDEYIDVFTGGYGVGGVITGSDTANHAIAVTALWPGGFSVTVNPNGSATIVITPTPTSGGSGGGSPVTVQADKLPTTIKDASGNIYQVNTNGSVTPVGNGGGKPLVDGANKKVIDNDKAIVQFINSANSKYAVDIWRQQYNNNSSFNKEYEKINYLVPGSNAPNGYYYVSSKAIAPGATDIVRAVITKVDNGIITDSIRFVNSKGTIYNATKINETTFDVTVVGGPAKDAQEIYAVCKMPAKTLMLGKLLLASYPEKNFNIVVVPVNSPVGFNFQSIADSLKSVYGTLNIKLNVSPGDNISSTSWDFDNDGLDVKGSGAFSVYTQEMKALQKVFKQTPAYNPSNFYLFVLTAAADSLVIGDMPKGKQFGYVFTQNNSHQWYTALHEVGHGLFRLKHITDYSGISNSDLPDNVMAYPSQSFFSKMQWDLIHDPGFVLGLFEKDADGEEIIVSNIREIVDKYKNQDGTLTFLSVAGKPLSIKVDKLTQLSFANEEDIFQKSATELPIGALAAFVYDGVRYVATKNANTNDFLGYRNNTIESSVVLFSDPYSSSKSYNNVLAGILCIKSGVPVFKLFPTNYLDVNTGFSNVATNNHGEGVAQQQFFLANYLQNESKGIELYGQIRPFTTEEAFYVDKYGSDKDICGAEALYFLSNVYYIQKSPSLLNCLKDAENDLAAKLSALLRNAALQEQRSNPVDNTTNRNYVFIDENKYYREEYSKKYASLAASTDASKELNTVFKEYSKHLTSGVYNSMDDLSISRIIKLFDLPEAQGRICLLKNLPIELRLKILDKCNQWKTEFSQSKESLLNDLLQYINDEDIQRLLDYLSANSYEKFWKLYDEINASQSDRFALIVARLVEKRYAKPFIPEYIGPYVESQQTNTLVWGKGFSSQLGSIKRTYSFYNSKENGNVTLEYWYSEVDIQTGAPVPDKKLYRKFSGSPFEYVRIHIAGDFRFANLNNEKIRDGQDLIVPAFWAYWLLHRQSTVENFTFVRQALDVFAVVAAIGTANPAPLVIVDAVVGGTDFVFTLAEEDIRSGDDVGLNNVLDLWDNIAAIYGTTVLGRAMINKAPSLVNGVREFRFNQSKAWEYLKNISVKEELKQFSERITAIVKSLKDFQAAKADIRAYTIGVLQNLGIKATIKADAWILPDYTFDVRNYNFVVRETGGTAETGLMKVIAEADGSVTLNNLRLYNDNYGAVQKVIGGTKGNYNIGNTAYEGDIIFVETVNKEWFVVTQENYVNSINLHFVSNLPFVGSFVAKSGIELRKFLNSVISKPLYRNYVGKFVKSISKAAEDNHNAKPDIISQYSIEEAWGRYDRSGESAMYYSQTVTGNQIEISYYGDWNSYSTYEYNNVTIGNMLDLTDDAVRKQIAITFDKLVLGMSDKVKAYEYTNIIGTWAREQGYKGLIVPGSRGAKDYVNIVVFKQSDLTNALLNIVPVKIK